MKKIFTGKGMFNYDDLTVKFGGEFSKPENIFTAQAIKVPAFKYKIKEREDAGGGCYWEGHVTNEYEENNLYAILKEGICIGFMLPYPKSSKIKSDLQLFEGKSIFKKYVLDFLKSKNINRY